MFFGGLPGGSPGPDAEASGKVLLFFVVFGVAAAAAMLWFMLHVADRMTLPVG